MSEAKALSQAMKKQRNISNNYNTYRTKKFKTPSIKKVDGPVALVVVILIIVYAWITFFTYFVDNGKTKDTGLGGSSSSFRRGLVFDMEKDLFHFRIQGLEYFYKNPIKRRANLAANQVWLLRPRTEGGITIRDLQVQLSHPTIVSVMIKYHISWGAKSKLTVSGVNYKTNEVVTNDLTQYGTGYCTRVLFFGLVHEIAVSALVSEMGEFILIDKFMVGLGLFVFEGIDEESCS